jgi:hypothetical protein
MEPRDIWAIRFYLDEHKRLRDRALFDLAIDSKPYMRRDKADLGQDTDFGGIFLLPFMPWIRGMSSIA